MKTKLILFIILIGICSCERNNTQAEKSLPILNATNEFNQIGKSLSNLNVIQWVKGEPIAGFEKGKIYIIDFWATWCGPCISSMPFLSNLQLKYKEEIVIIGVTNEDKWGNTLESVNKLVKEKGSLINFRIAWLEPSKPEGNLTGIFLHDWMRAIGTQNLPMTFVIDKDGKVAYIGETLTIEKVIPDLISGNYDLNLASDTFSKNIEATTIYDEFRGLFKNGNYEKSYKLAELLVEDKEITKARIFSGIADKINNNSEINEGRWINLGLKSAKKSVELSNFKNSGYLDALAAAYAKNENLLQAIITEKLAISLAEGSMKKAQEENLKKYGVYFQKK